MDDFILTYTDGYWKRNLQAKILLYFGMDIVQLRKEQYFIILGTEAISWAMTTWSFLSFPPMPHCSNHGCRCLHWMNTCPIYARRKGNKEMACLLILCTQHNRVITWWRNVKKAKFSMIKRRESRGKWSWPFRNSFCRRQRAGKLKYAFFKDKTQHALSVSLSLTIYLLR